MMSRVPCSGFVSLVGAGPGAADLITLRGVERLRRADLVLYDALVPKELLRHAASAWTFYVGKRAGRPSLAQPTIEALMVRAARRGQCVVRLKCGDPFVLGRGGEEALALARAAVPFEVVPGLSSALAAPGALSIPVTLRGVAAAFMVVSGHDPDRFRELLEGITPNAITVVVLMGLTSRRALASVLLSAGWRSDTPCALALAATCDASEQWLGELGALEQSGGLEALPRGAPGTLIFGDVVNVARELSELSELNGLRSSRDLAASQR